MRDSASEHAGTGRPVRGREIAARIALTYLVLAAGWILLSDWLAYIAADTAPALLSTAIVKGLLFVGVTTVLLFVLLDRTLCRQQRVEQALAERQRQLATLIGNLPGMVYRCRNDAARTVEFVSDAVEVITGYAVGELFHNRRLSFNDLIHPEDRLHVRREVDSAIAGNRRFEIEYRIRPRSGEERWVRERGVAVADGEGRIAFTEGFIEDVTDRHRADAALRESEERFRLLVEGTRDSALFMLDAEGRVMTWNAGAERILGYGSEEILGRHLSCFYRPEDVAGGVPDTVLEQARRVGVCNDEGWRLRKDGSRFWANTTLTALRDESGHLCGFSKLMRDRTLQHQQELQLQESEARLRALYDESPVMYFMLSPEGTIQSVNAYGAEYLGYGVDELCGRSIYELIHPDDHPFARQILAQFADDAGVTRRWDLRQLHRSGHVIWSRQTARSVGSGSGRRMIHMVCEDITEVQQLSEALEYQSVHDPLTGLLNRRELERRLAHLIDNMVRDRSRHALCYIDLDQFVLINDACGSAGGDELLRRFAILLRDFARQGDIPARMGGDEFAILIQNCSPELAENVAAKLKAGIRNFRFDWDGQSFHISASIGVVMLDEQSTDVSEILRMADAACYTAKSEGRDAIHLYDSGHMAQSGRLSEMQWANLIRRALDENRLCLMRQRIQALDEHAPAGLHCELLVRLLDDDGAELGPGLFMPAAERFGLAAQIDRWVVGAACDWLAADARTFADLELCAINLSGQSLGDAEFLDFVVARLDAHDVAGKVCFEITETAAISNYTQAIRFIQRLREYGCRFALDDFGSGLSSFGYLKHLPVDILKIDGLFVRHMNRDAMDYAMVKTINELAHVMGKKTVAEFVEEAAQIDRLRELGVDYAQGYAIERPVRL